MANPHRGEVALAALGKTFTACFSINAMCALEARLGRSIVEIALELEAVKDAPATLRMTTVRAVTWAALQQHHPDLTEDHAGDILADAGFTEVMGIVLAAIYKAFPAAPAKGSASRPPVAEG